MALGTQNNSNDFLIKTVLVFSYAITKRIHTSIIFLPSQSVSIVFKYLTACRTAAAKGLKAIYSPQMSHFIPISPLKCHTFQGEISEAKHTTPLKYHTLFAS